MDDQQNPLSNLPQDESNSLPAVPAESALDNAEHHVPTPEELTRLEEEMDERRAVMDMKKTALLSQLEDEATDSRFGELMRSKNFWYCVFGLIFFLWMGALIAWVAHDLAK